jgi:hypothetical protein
LTSDFEEDDALKSVDVEVAVADGEFFRATARLFFNDDTFEQKVRYFS